MDHRACEDLSPAETILIVGLGNPGDRYGSTRHNAGFQVVERVAQKCRIAFAAESFQSIWGRGIIDGHPVLLVKPLTYMNRSGEAVREVLSCLGIPGSSMLVVHDDLDLPFGRIKLARAGGAGGHRGILSIIECLGEQSFSRLKLGIGRPALGEPIEEFVLQPPYREDQAVYGEMIARAAEAVIAFISVGFEPAANRFNRKDTTTHTPPETPA